MESYEDIAVLTDRSRLRAALGALDNRELGVVLAEVLVDLNGRGGNPLSDVLRAVGPGRDDRERENGEDVSEENNRWGEFSDEEVKLIDAAMSALEQDENLIGFAVEFANEVEREHDRREDAMRATTYRGPGYYTDVASGTTIRVVGQVTIDRVLCLLVGSHLNDPHLWSLPASKIEGRDEHGRRRYEYSTVQP